MVRRINVLLASVTIVLLLSWPFPMAANEIVECEWLKTFVNKSSQKGKFPIGPKQVTWTVGSAPKIPVKYKKIHQIYADYALDKLGLPIAFNEDKNSSTLLIFFHTKQLSTKDRPGIFAELQSEPRADFFTYKMTPLYDLARLDTCSYVTSYVDRTSEVGKITVKVPFDRKTGAPIPGAENCIINGALRAFGVGSEDHVLGGPDGTEDCYKCVEVGRRMALILAENNNSEQRVINADSMLKKLSSPICNMN